MRLAARLAPSAAAEAEGGVGGPEVGGAGVEPRLADFLTRSPRMQEFVELVRRVIPADTTLLILGPTGVGKEHLARAIHGESTRAKRPFVTVNCAALPAELIESELFGHERGDARRGPGRSGPIREPAADRRQEIGRIGLPGKVADAGAPGTGGSPPNASSPVRGCAPSMKPWPPPATWPRARRWATAAPPPRR